MKNSQIGFLSPDNKLSFMEYDEAYYFCKKICEEEINKERFLEFKKDYSYFNPYFDFIMFELDYIMINGLYRNRCVTRYQNSLYEILNSNDLYDYDYTELKLNDVNNYDKFPLITKCSDKILRIKSLSQNLDACIINPNGITMMSSDGTDNDRGSHSVTCRTILNQMLLENIQIVDDYLQYGHNAGNYLIENHGFLKVTSKDEGGFIIGNSLVMSTELYQTVSSLPEYIFSDISKSQSYVFSSSSEKQR